MHSNTPRCADGWKIHCLALLKCALPECHPGLYMYNDLPRNYESYLQPQAVLGVTDAWLKQPFVRAVTPGPNHCPLLRNLLEAAGVAGNL
jgi:hypothetical protein